MSENLDPYYSRHDNDGMGPLPALALIVMGLALGMVIMGVARSCDRVAEPVVVSIKNMECRLCHAPVLTTYKKYRAYHKAMRKSPEVDLIAELVRP